MASGLGQRLVEQYREIHATKTYGASSEKQLGFIYPHTLKLGTVRTILDYGCGRSRLVDWLAKLHDATAFRYDPAIPQFSIIPGTAFDLALNTDVLEHIPEVDLDEVIGRIAGLSKRVFFNISTVPAKAILPSGENAHCTVRPPQWWQKRLGTQFRKVREVRSYKGSTCSFITW